MEYVEVIYKADQRYKEGRKLVSRRIVSESTYLYSRAIEDANPGGPYSMAWYAVAESRVDKR